MRRMLTTMHYSLQANRKTREGRQHPDRDGHFAISAPGCGPATSRRTSHLGGHQEEGSAGKPEESWKNLSAASEPAKVKTHDFPDLELGKAVPYGVYDIHGNEAGVSVGISHDTAEFAVGAIRRWWQKLGRKRYRGAKRLLVTADSGGSNSSRCRLWKVALQKWADETGLIIEVCHYPPGTSKWNKIEHRLFCHITRNWQGVPLETLEIVVQSIAARPRKRVWRSMRGSTKARIQKAAK